MAQRISIAQLWMLSDQVEKLMEFRDQASQELSKGAGFSSLSVWKDADFPERYAFVAEYGRGVSGAWEQMSEAEMIESVFHALEASPDVRVLKVESRHGSPISELQFGELMSVSMRTADPGQAADLEAEIYDIFENLKLIPGYRGSVYGPNVKLPEEVIAVAFWRNMAAFQSSMPRKPFYEIRLYERIA